MKKILSIWMLVVASFTAHAQFYNPVSWEFSQKNLPQDEIELSFKATIEGDWYMYSQHIADDGPVPTTFTFFNAEGVELLTEVLEPEPIEEFDPNFDMVLKYFKKEVTFRQRLKSVSDTAFSLTGEVMFMTCDPMQCLPPEYVEFSFDLPAATQEVKVTEDTPTTSSKGMWGIFFIAFLSGFAALLTPCVFPMIPMTVSFLPNRVKIKPRVLLMPFYMGFRSL